MLSVLRRWLCCCWFVVFVNSIVDVCNYSMFCCTLLYAHSSFAIILIGKRALGALLGLSSWCHVVVVWFSSRCHGFVCSLWLWYYLIILTMFVRKYMYSKTGVDQGKVLTKPNISLIPSFEVIVTRVLLRMINSWNKNETVIKWWLSRDMWFPAMWYFDKCKLRRACTASF